MVMSITLSLVAIRRRDIASHRAWIIRGYAIGQGAGTQVLTSIAWLLLVGTPGPITGSLLLGVAWIINLAVAEWIIRRAGLRGGKTARKALLVAAQPLAGPLCSVRNASTSRLNSSARSMIGICPVSG